MKLTNYYRLLNSLILFAVAAIGSNACGPCYYMVPSPEFFGFTYWHKSMSEYEQEENLLYWRSQTSERIPLSDIKDVVYNDSWSEFVDHTGNEPCETNNQFYAYLNKARDTEAISFLKTAKSLEKRWQKIRSPWHYPRSREQNSEVGNVSDIIEQCKAYKGVRFKDRYALQVTRALFAAREYAACIEYADSAFADIPDTNLMKRMAQRYSAGSYSRLGDTVHADSMFAKGGDIWSISLKNPVEYMANINPNAPQLVEYIRDCARDTSFMCGVFPVARKLVSSSDLKCRGDWYFIMAYIDNEFNNNKSAARKYIRQAVGQKFSTQDFADLARVYKMKLDAAAGVSSDLLADLKWLGHKMDNINLDADEWISRCRNIIYVDWVPLLWEKKDYSTAILLCSYADNLAGLNLRPEPWSNVAWNAYWEFVRILSISGLYQDERIISHVDYGSLSFQMMGSLSSEELLHAYNRMFTDNPLYSFLRRKARTDKDYYYELIATIALREENYARAEKYLSKVSELYLRSMNLDKFGYLDRDPFRSYPSRWVVESTIYGDSEPTEWEHATKCHLRKSNPKAKLEFARKMQEYKRIMTCGRTADERGIARLMYAIGRRNSFEECWALTQYWRGKYSGKFEPIVNYWEEEIDSKKYAFLYDYEETIGHKTTEKIYDREVKASLAMLKGDEAKAQANYILNNLKTVVKYYGNTTVARHIKTSCDNWQSWL